VHEKKESKPIGKDKYPKPGELVLATVKSIYPYGAFCLLDEYPGKEGFIHVSEVAPRWIKNIHEFLSERQHIVLRVIRIDKEKGHIDVSLKRVTKPEREKKIEQVRRNKRARKLIELAGRKAKAKKATMEKVFNILENEYDDLYLALEDIFENGDEVVKELKLPKIFGKKLVEVVMTHIKKPIVSLNIRIKLVVYAPNGVDVITNALKGISGNGISVIYAGAPNYLLSLKGDDYKKLEKKLTKIIKGIEKRLSKTNYEFSYEKVKI